MAVISVSDNGDGTGAVVSLAANTGVAKIYASAFLGSNASRMAVEIGEIDGNGTLDFAGGLGPHLIAGVNDAGLIAPIHCRITDVGEDIHWQCLNGVREFVLSLDLPGVMSDPDSHYVVKLPYNPDEELAIDNGDREYGVFYFPKPEQYTTANNMEESASYFVQVLLIRKAGRKNSDGLEQLLSIRQKMALSFAHCPLPDVEAVHSVYIQPGSIILPDRWLKSYDCSSLVFRCVSEQPSGIL